MRILTVNVNTTESMTEGIGEQARKGFDEGSNPVALNRARIHTGTLQAVGGCQTSFQGMVISASLTIPATGIHFD